MIVFSQILRNLLAQRRLRISDWSKRVSLSHGYVSNLCAGRRAPPLHKIAGWAARLELDDSQTERFWQAAILANIPRTVLPHLERLLAADGQSRQMAIEQVALRCEVHGLQQDALSLAES